jgi:tetratricopeptide (TPR) repeat protein
MDQSELFKDYLENRLSEQDKALFEKLLAESPTYQQELEDFKKQFLNHSDSKPKSRIKTWIFTFFIAILVATGGVLLFLNLSTPIGEKLYKVYYKPFPVEKLKPLMTNPTIKDGREAYLAKNYEEAITRFEYLEVQGESDQVKFFLGLSYLGNDRPEKAIPVFSMISSSSSLYGNTSWYTALAYLKLNKLNEARSHLQKATSTPGLFRREAAEILKQYE